MIGNGDPVLAWIERFNEHVASLLIHLPITELLAEELYEVRSAQITRQSHARAKSSSLTRCRRIADGLG